MFNEVMSVYRRHSQGMWWGDDNTNKDIAIKQINNFKGFPVRIKHHFVILLFNFFT